MFLLNLLTDNIFWQILSVLKKWDTWLFLKINTEWTNPFLDSVFPWWRDQNTWIPLYIFLSLLVFMNFGWKAWKWLACVFLTLLLTELVSSHILKNWVARPRPCNDDVLKYYVRALLGWCSNSGSFTSSHATNHFGVGTFFFLTLRPYLKNWSYLFFIWAATICYGQVYVGVHYPGDIICGAILGCLTGWGIANMFEKNIGMPPLLEWSPLVSK